ncbi:hypothetical protein D3C72_1192610 [compost metagenome]
MLLVLQQAHGVAGGQAAHGAGAVELLVVQFQRLQHALAVRPRRRAVGMQALAGAVIHGQLRQLPGLQAGDLLGGGRRHLFRVPAADADGIRLHLAARAEAVDGVVRIGGAHAVKAHVGAARRLRRRGLAVEDHQFVPGLRLAVAAFLRAARLVVLETPAQAFGGQQAREEIEVAFAVLGTDGARGQRLADVEFEAQLRVVGQQLGDDVARMLVLKNIAVAAQPQQGQGRFEAQPVARHAAVGAQPGAIGADAVPGALATVGLKQAQRHFLADEGGQVQAGRSAQGIDFEAEQFIDGLAALELFRHQRFRLPRLLRRGQGDEPRMLAQAGAELARVGGGLLCAAHHGRVMLRLATRGASLTMSL